MNQEEYRKEVGKRLYKTRKENGLSLAALGEKVGLAESSVKKYEDGNIKEISYNRLIKFAKALEIDMDYLACDDLIEKHNISASSFIHSESDKKVLDLYNSLDDEKKKMIISLMMAFKKE